MAAGVPVVASHSGGVFETVMHQQTGFLVEKNNPQQVADAILTLLEKKATLGPMLLGFKLEPYLKIV